MPISEQDAYNATNPDPAAYNLPADAPADQVDAKRKEAATNIMAGIAANDVYWDHRPELEALKAHAQGHSDVPPPPGSADSTAGAIEATAVEEPAQITAPSPSPGNPQEAIAKLRAQLTASGINPEA